jgi:hypothetical protein
MTLYHPRALAEKLEGLVPELRRWSHRAGLALDNAQIQQKRIEDRNLQTSHNAQMHEHQLVVDQQHVRQDEELLQTCARNCQETLAKAQQTASIAQSILNETQTTYNRMQQALQSAREALTQAEQALEQATTNVASKTAEFAKANACGTQDDKQTANDSLLAAKKAQSQASRTVQAASAHLAKCAKAVTLASQALQLAKIAHQHAQAGLKASEDSVGFVRAASRALDMGKRELGQQDAVIKITLEALQHAAQTTQESSTQLVAAHSHEQPAQQHTSDILHILQIKIGLLIFMNRPEVEVTSDPSAAALQIAAVVDTGQPPQTSTRKLEILQTKLEKIYGFKPNQWSRLNLEERLEVLQDAHNALAATYSFTPVSVTITQLPPKVAGSFSQTKEIISIDKKLITGDDQIETLATLIHESRHAYQWYLIKRFRYGPAFLSEARCAQAQEWGDNFDNYKTGEQYGTKAYHNQPIEVDAFGFEEIVISFLFGK